MRPGDPAPLLPFEQDGTLQLKYYMFDWDDNVLFMPTRIHLERETNGSWVPYDVSTGEFARIRRDLGGCRPRNGDWDAAFADFYDTGPRGAQGFVDDIRIALDDLDAGRTQRAPSYEKFLLALREGRLFAIVTARSHAAATIRKGVEYFIRRAMPRADFECMMRNLRGFRKYFGEDEAGTTDDQVLARYLDLNHYSGVNSPEFRQRMGRQSPAGAENPEMGKQFAIRQFVQHVIDIMRRRGVDLPVSVGFSDDDVHNVTSVEEFIRAELTRAFPDIKFVVLDTSASGERKIVIRSSQSLTPET